jgi:hypothetical protein
LVLWFFMHVTKGVHFPRWTAFIALAAWAINIAVQVWRVIRRRIDGKAS